MQAALAGLDTEGEMLGRLKIIRGVIKKEKGWVEGALLQTRKSFVEALDFAMKYIENDGDYRVIVLGDKVLGVMKRSCQKEGEFRNNYSAGGSVRVADLSDEIKELALKAAKTCGLLVAGVDIVFRDYDEEKPVIWEVNKGPQFSGFMKATGIDVPMEIVKFLVNLTISNHKSQITISKIKF